MKFTLMTRSLLRDAGDVALAPKFLVALRVLPTLAFGLNLGERYHAATEKARATWLQVGGT